MRRLRSRMIGSTGDKAGSEWSGLVGSTARGNECAGSVSECKPKKHRIEHREKRTEKRGRTKEQRKSSTNRHNVLSDTTTLTFCFVACLRIVSLRMAMVDKLSDRKDARLALNKIKKRGEGGEGRERNENEGGMRNYVVNSRHKARTHFSFVKCPF